jgi:environmental stress-induced protein Ves
MGAGQSRVIPANDYRRARWKNGLGWTREIACSPETGDWNWRVSIAEIERGAEFSSFPGIERELVLLSGNGLRLLFDDGEMRELLPPHDQSRFSGERQVRGELLDGPTHDFNLMWRRERLDAQLWRRPLVGPMLLFADAGETWVLHLLSGRGEFADGSGLAPLEAGDSAVLEAGELRLRHVLEGGGELLLARLRERGAASG